MLVLTRRIGEELVIGGLIRVRVIAVSYGRVKLGITAPEEIAIDREEVHQALQRFPGSNENTTWQGSAGSTSPPAAES